MVLLTAVFVLAGCGGEGSGSGAPEDGRVELVGLDEPLKQPVYAPSNGEVIALDEKGERLVRLEVSGGSGPEEPLPVTLSEELAGSGENLALNREESGETFIPQPERDQAQVLENDDLLDVRAITNIGEAPVRVALDYPEDALFALSADGSTVTAVSLDTFDVIGEERVDGSEETLMDTPLSGEGGVFWLAGPQGMALHELNAGEPRTRTALDAATLAVDANNAERAYASEAGTGRVVAVEPGTGGDIDAEADLSEEVLDLAAEPGRLYALTGSELVVLDAADLGTIASIELSTSAVLEATERVEPSGMAVGDEGVVVTLEGEPAVLLVEKP